MAPVYYDRGDVARLLDYPGCIKAVREAMIALSGPDANQQLRNILDLGDGRLFGLMPGHLLSQGSLGAKLVTVFPQPEREGRSRHLGVVVVFESERGTVECLCDAEEITRVRTGCATAAATDALARPDSEILAILGTGTQAEAHVRALSQIRSFRKIWLWGRSAGAACDLAARMSRELSLDIAVAASPREAAAEADVICTVTSSATPVLLGEWVKPGTHVNLVGSSHLGPVEVDSALVAAARYIADYRPSALSQAAEFDVARKSGLISDEHLACEIGEVFAGLAQGRQSSEQITIYKSLGHIVQDLAAARYAHNKALLTAERNP